MANARFFSSRLLLPLLILAVSACGMGEAATAGEVPSLDRCYADEDCPTGLSCVAAECVADDEAPPETPDPRTFLPPLSSERYVFALSPDGNTVAVIDPALMAVESIPLPAEPVELAVVPGSDEIVVLSRAGAALSLLSLGAGGPRLSIQPVGRKLSSLSLSPDARWAILWNREGEPLDAGAEGRILLVDVSRLRTGDPAPAIERVAGRRHTDLFFRRIDGSSGPIASDAVVVGKEELAVFELADPAAQPIPERIPLPAAFAEITTRRVVASADGAFVVFSSLASTDLLVFDVESRSLGTLPIGAPTSDLAISLDGSVAVAVQRSAGKASWFELREALADPAALRSADVALPGSSCELPGCTVSPGQVRIAPDASFALLFTNSNPTESFGRLDLDTGGWRVFDRIQKEVKTIAISRSGRHALVLHRQQPESTVADAYERQVDHSDGYSVVELEGGLAQLVLTGDAQPRDAIFLEDTPYAAISLRSDSSRVFRVDAIDLETLVSAPLQLASAPEYAGPLAAPLSTRIWVSQVHAAGRISFVDLATRSTRTISGYELNGEIE